MMLKKDETEQYTRDALSEDEKKDEENEKESFLKLNPHFITISHSRVHHYWIPGHWKIVRSTAIYNVWLNGN